MGHYTFIIMSLRTSSDSMIARLQKSALPTRYPSSEALQTQREAGLIGKTVEGVVIQFKPGRYLIKWNKRRNDTVSVKPSTLEKVLGPDTGKNWIMKRVRCTITASAPTASLPTRDTPVPLCARPHPGSQETATNGPPNSSVAVAAMPALSPGLELVTVYPSRQGPRTAR